MNSTHTSKVTFTLYTLIVLLSLSPLHTSAAGESVYITGKSPSGVISPGSTVTFSSVASGFVDPVYSVSDSFSASGATLGTIDKIGNFTWTPGIYDAGLHPITVSVSDQLLHTASTTTSILVASNIVILKDLLPSATVEVKTPITFNLVAPGFITPQYSIYDSFYSSSINSSLVNSSGTFAWTPSLDDVGVHNLTVVASDIYGHRAEVKQSITIKNPVVLTATSSATTSSATITASTAPAVTNVSSTSSNSATTPTITNKYTFTTLLSVGSRGTAVTELQKRLAKLGFFTGSISSYFGTMTAASVKKFQKSQGILQTGATGPATRAALNKN